MLVSLQSKGYSIQVNTLGAELKSFKNPKGTEYIWNSDPTYWMRSSPLLFPSVGNVRNGKTIFYGNEYELGKHGFAKESEFELEMLGENKANFILKDNKSTKASYPFSFTLTLTYELIGPKLNLNYQITNEDEKEMYFHIGAHPGFMCPIFEGETFQDYCIRFPKEETCDCPVYDLENLCVSTTNKVRLFNHAKELQLDYSLFDQDAVILEAPISKSVQLVHATKGHGVEVDFSDFTTIAFWTPDHNTAPFLCIEPWNGSAIYADESDEFKEKRNIQTLSPAKTKTYTLGITLLEN